MMTEKADLQNDPDAWFDAVNSEFPLTDTGRIMLDLARQALKIANDTSADPDDRFAAVVTFKSLIAQIGLSESEPEGG